MKIGRIPIGFGTGAEIVIGRLRDHGIRTVFSIPGSQVLPLWDVIRRFDDMRLVVPRNERSSAFLGEGWGRIATVPAVVMDTLGPGVANEAPGAWSASASQTPVIYVAPAQPAWKRSRMAEVFQGLDHERFFDGLVKRTLTADRRSELTAKVDLAMAEAMSGLRGPVRLDVSFPLLFERAFGVIPSEHTGRHEPSSMDSGPILICETKEDKDFNRLARFGLDDPCDRVLAPGIGNPGHALPFALGAKFAALDRPVVVATALDHLMANVETLLTARQQSIPVRLVAFGAKASDTAQHLSAITGALAIKTARRAGDRTADLLDSAALTIAVTD